MCTVRVGAGVELDLVGSTIVGAAKIGDEDSELGSGSQANSSKPPANTKSRNPFILFLLNNNSKII
jgi:hypothetical protein